MSFSLPLPNGQWRWEMFYKSEMDKGDKYLIINIES